MAFMLAALNDVDILACDIGNAYLNAKPRENVYTTAGPEFGAELQGKTSSYCMCIIRFEIKRCCMARSPCYNLNTFRLYLKSS